MMHIRTDAHVQMLQEVQEAKQNFWLQVPTEAREEKDAQELSDQAVLSLYQVYGNGGAVNTDFFSSSSNPDTGFALIRVAIQQTRQKSNQDFDLTRLKKYAPFMLAMQGITQLKNNPEIYNYYLNFYKENIGKKYREKFHNNKIVNVTGSNSDLIQVPIEGLTSFIEETKLNDFADLVSKIALFANDTNHLRVIHSLSQSEDGQDIILSLTPEDLKLFSKEVLTQISDFIKKDQSGLQKGVNLHNLFFSLKESVLVQFKHRDLLLKRFFYHIQHILHQEMQQHTNYKESTFYKKQEELLKQLKCSNEQEYSGLLDSYFKRWHYVYSTHAALNSLNAKQSSQKTIDNSDLKEDKQTIQPVPQLSPLLIDLKNKLIRQAQLEFKEILKSNSLDYQGKASQAIVSIAHAFEKLTPESVNEMLRAAAQLRNSRSYLASWMLIAAGVLVMLLGYAAATSTFGMSAYIGEQWGMTLIGLGGAGGLLATGIRGFQFFAPRLEKTMEQAGPELRKHYHAQNIVAR